MNHAEIENKAQELLKKMWLSKDALWPLGTPHPIDMLDIAVATKVLGVDFQDNEALSNFGQRDSRFEIAGLIDRQANRIAVSGRFDYLTRRFTAAHEIGHWVMHDGEIMHRDLPVKGLADRREKRAPMEAEADHFAACFLMPKKLVRSTFQDTFLTELPFVFNDDTAFFLNPSNPKALLYSDPESLERAKVLASATSYAGRHFSSLAERFRVSTTSMAIRIQELRLIRYP